MFLGFWLGYLGMLSYVLGGALRFFNIYNITYKKYIYILEVLCLSKIFSKLCVFYLEFLV